MECGRAAPSKSFGHRKWDGSTCWKEQHAAPPKRRAERSIPNRAAPHLKRIENAPRCFGHQAGIFRDTPKDDRVPGKEHQQRGHGSPDYGLPNLVHVALVDEIGGEWKGGLG